MSHYRLLFPEGEYGRYSSEEKAENAASIHREYGDDPMVIEVPGELVIASEYGGTSTVDGVPVSRLPLAPPRHYPEE